MTEREFDPPLDPGITEFVLVLREAGIETFASCQGGDGHPYPRRTVRFEGTHAEGFRAYAVAAENGLDPSALRRVWDVIDGEPTGPFWELIF